MAVAFGKQVIDTGPCTDPTNNFQELANVLEALGNPYLDDEGIENPWGGTNFTEGCGITITSTPGEHDIAVRRKPGGGIACDPELGLYTTVTGGGEVYTAGFGIDISVDNVISWTGSTGGGDYMAGAFIDPDLLAQNVIEVIAIPLNITVVVYPWQ